MAPYILTRFLYIKDEVELSLVSALLKKRNVQECYYWAFELYYSGFDIVQLLWKIYLDFYYELNPIMEDYMNKKLSSSSHIAVASIVRNLYRLKSSPNTFILRQYIKGDILPSVIYIKNDNKFHKILKSLENKNIGDVCYYIKDLLDTMDLVHDVFTDLLQQIKINIKININIINSSSSLHYLLAVICRSNASIVRLNKCNIFVKPNETDIDFINKVEHEPIPVIHKRGFDIEQTYNTLGFKRYFKICETIGSFKLSRWSVNDTNDYQEFLKMNWFHWEYYACGGSAPRPPTFNGGSDKSIDVGEYSGCPLWCSRLAKCNGTLNHSIQDIVFPDDEFKEQFYNLYAYEFDEQPKEIQMMSHCDLRKNTWQYWYDDIFKEKPIIVLNDEFKFMNY